MLPLKDLEEVNEKGECNAPNPHRARSVSTKNFETNEQSFPYNWTKPRLKA